MQGKDTDIVNVKHLKVKNAEDCQKTSETRSKERFSLDLLDHGPAETLILYF